ncbi:hypothetical protein [Aquimarina agarilytica]|uniref:hypothetical protein n=1 Tax=Aquimarina agarilytica TaxID=1087449 RepID=UPI00028834F5|nr:hypothetical protein [Aquimarina agarilytica]
MNKLEKYHKQALIIGVFAAFISSLGTLALGNLSGYEAKELIKSSLPGINVLCNTIVLASATILALLLTLLGLSSSSTNKLKKSHYYHVLAIAKLDTIVFVVSMLVFQLLNIPITESESVPNSWFKIVYYISLISASILSGSLISVVIMLYTAVRNIITIVGLGKEDHPLIHTNEKE